MTREEAIEYVLGSAKCIAGEFSTSSEEDAEIRAEACEALVALGVTQEEIERIR
jgi:Holliday junction resolvasome RuvABC DNA-binding subunit